MKTIRYGVKTSPVRWWHGVWLVEACGSIYEFGPDDEYARPHRTFGSGKVMIKCPLCNEFQEVRKVEADDDPPELPLGASLKQLQSKVPGWVRSFQVELLGEKRSDGVIIEQDHLVGEDSSLEGALWAALYGDKQGDGTDVRTPERRREEDADNPPLYDLDALQPDAATRTGFVNWEMVPFGPAGGQQGTPDGLKTLTFDTAEGEFRRDGRTYLEAVAVLIGGQDTGLRLGRYEQADAKVDGGWEYRHYWIRIGDETGDGFVDRDDAVLAAMRRAFGG